MRFFRFLSTFNAQQQSLKPRDVKHHLRTLYGIDSGADTASAVSSEPAPTFNPDSPRDVLDYLRKTKALVAQTVAELDEMTPKQIDRACLVYPTIGQRRYSSSRKLPSPPAIWTRKSLKGYLEELTGKRFTGNERLTDQIGLVSHMVADLLRPTNRATRQSLTVGAYNIGVRYFLGVKDIEAARKLLENMSGSFLEPDTDTLNYFLWPMASNISANPYRRSKGHPLVMVLQTLHRMKKHNVKANTETWNLALQAMPMGFGKSFLVEEMARRHIDLNERSLAVCTLAIAEKNGSEAAIEWAFNYSDTLPLGVLNLLLALQLKTKLPDNYNVAQALRLLDIASSKYSVKPNVHTMNTFLESFAHRRHLDWQMGVLTLLRDVYHVKPSPQSVEYLLEAALGQKETAQKYAMFGMVLARFREMPTTARTRVLIRRAVRRAEKRGLEVSDPGKTLWNELCKAAEPKDKITLKNVDVDTALAGRTGAPVKIPDCQALARTDSDEYLEMMNENLKWNYHSFMNYVNKRTE